MSKRTKPTVSSRLRIRLQEGGRRRRRRELTFIEVRICQLSSHLLDDLDVLQVGRSLCSIPSKSQRSQLEVLVQRNASSDWKGREEGRSTDLEPENSVDGEVGEVVLVLREDLGREGGSSDVDEILTESSRVGAEDEARRRIEKSVSFSSPSSPSFSFLRAPAPLRSFPKPPRSSKEKQEDV